jgi:hypothetical protein
VVDPLVEESARRSGLVWVALDGDPVPHPVWHVWHDGAVLLVTGGAEQPLPGAAQAARAVVSARSAERQGDLLTRWTADVEHVQPGTARWDEVVPLLHESRLNAPDGEQQPARWARDSRVLRLVPDGGQLPVTP